MAKLDWSKARPRRDTEQAFPGHPQSGAAAREERKWLRKLGLESLGVSEEDIHAARSPEGGWTRETLAKWGVPWPPPKGWRRALISGGPIPQRQPTPAPRPPHAHPAPSSMPGQPYMAVRDYGPPTRPGEEKPPWE